ncbi:TPA: hypothetical protein ACX6QU_003177 [Photobacterium damselae]|uniref:Uncharacterized protein n=1 Tax=Photobacterium damselae subsp. damselae TaxID=85581 RepID=A0A850R634_PHODD|nr:hypothetical protein [Photobacterium damselae]KAB1176197.1 hypothetical protein F6450_18370 [Photobacterium damselae subsp. damselae]NVP02899.1 hypothetical protein [Photobacterium damselae subsp. damselae]
MTKFSQLQETKFQQSKTSSKASIHFTTMEQLVEHIIDRMVDGECFTKGDINRLIPCHLSISSDDVIKKLRHNSKFLKVTNQRPAQGDNSYWYIQTTELKEWQKAPEHARKKLNNTRMARSDKQLRGRLNTALKRKGNMTIADIQEKLTNDIEAIEMETINVQEHLNNIIYKRHH